MEELTKYIVPAIIIIAAIVVIVMISNKIKKVTRNVQRTVRSVRSTISDVSNIASTIKTVAGEMDEIVEPKSVGGSTSMFLKQIERDFPDYHNPDAENAIKTFLMEYINIRYGAQKDFTNSKIDDKILINIRKEPNGKVSNMIFNGIAIYGYKKTKDYATVTYRCSLGFDYNGKRIETRYEVDYTLQLADRNVASLSMKCPNCGGTYSSTKDTCCPYCGAGIIKDTILNWFITETYEI